MANYDPVATLAEVLSPKNARAQPLSDLGFHQGLVLAWNATTGQNTIQIAGAPIVDVPMLNIGDTVNINLGDTVAVLRYRNSYFILGRVVLPNSEVFATSAIHTISGWDSTEGYSITTTETTRATVVLNIPNWSNRVQLTSNVLCTGYNSTASNDAIYASIWVDGIGGFQTLQDVRPSSVGTVPSFDSTTIDVTPGGTVTIIGRTKTAFATWAADGLNRTVLIVSAIFTRTT